MHDRQRTHFEAVDDECDPDVESDERRARDHRVITKTWVLHMQIEIDRGWQVSAGSTAGVTKEGKYF